MTRDRVPPTAAMTPVKLAIVAILAIVLVVVLVVQFSGENPAPVALKRRTPKNLDGTSSTTANSTPTIGNHRMRWPDIQRDEVSQFDPFAIPDGLRPKAEPVAAPLQPSQPIQVAQTSDSAPAQPAVSATSTSPTKDSDERARIRAQERKSRIMRIQATATALQQQGVGLVMSTSTGAVARIGDEEVRVGDVINGVLRVVEITPQGIVVEETPEEPQQTKPE